MDVLNENIKAWLEDELIPTLKSSLKKNNSAVSYKVSIPQDSFFVSQVFFLDLKFVENEKGEFNSEFNLVVKQPTSLKTINEALKVDVAFSKEILFYETFAKDSSDYPQCFYTLDQPPYDSIIVLENLTKRDYQICSKKVNLKMEFVLAAVQEIARLHAKSYILKEKRPKEYSNFMKEINKLNSRSVKSKSEVPLILAWANAIGARIVKYLRRINYDKAFCDKIEPLLVNTFEKIVKKAKKPRESLVTLCHGDFVRNNIFFRKKYNQMQAKLIDFGTIEFNSPGRDLAKFLILNCTREIRTSRLNDILDTYHKALMDCFVEANITNLERFPKKYFVEEYKANAFCSFVWNAFFIPRIYDQDLPSVEVLINLSEEKFQRIYHEVGGDEMTKIFVGILQDLRETGCLNFYLE